MSQLLSGRNRGRFGAPPEANANSSPWRAVPLYILVPLTVITLVASVPAWMAYYACGDRDSAFCITAGSLRPVETGTLDGIVAVTGALFALAVVLLLVATLRVRKGPLVLVYAAAVIALLLVVYAFLVLNGSIATPAGSLGDIRRP